MCVHVSDLCNILSRKKIFFQLGIKVVSLYLATLPFNVRFVSDDSELGTEIDATMGPPTGRIGFSLTYRQLDC